MRVLAFYSFFEITHPIKIKESINNHISKLGIEGSILLSSEGINGTILVPDEHENFIQEFSKLKISKDRSANKVKTNRPTSIEQQFQNSAKN